MSNNPTLLDTLKLSNIPNISSLERYGEYSIVKLYIEEKIGLPLQVKNWKSLYNKVQKINSLLTENRDEINLVLSKDKSLKDIGGFSETKQYISNMTGIKFTVNSWERLEERFKFLIVAFKDFKEEDAEFLFEKNKIQNFIHSSRLEGININHQLCTQDIDIIVKKYTNNPVTNDG